MFDSYLSEIKNSMSNFFFNLFASIIIISVFMTISVNNAIYAVLFLILAFFSSMCILFLIYVGAITILFLFVVMMLKIKINEKNTTKFISFINIIICCLIIYNVLLNTDIFNVFLNTDLTYTNWFSNLYYIDNIKMLGQVIFNNYYFYFILSGFVLLIGMISAILLSKESNKVVRRYQLVYQQLSREVSNAVFLVH